MKFHAVVMFLRMLSTRNISYLSLKCCKFLLLFLLLFFGAIHKCQRTFTRAAPLPIFHQHNKTYHVHFTSLHASVNAYPAKYNVYFFKIKKSKIVILVCFLWHFFECFPTWVILFNRQQLTLICLLILERICSRTFQLNQTQAAHVSQVLRWAAWNKNVLKNFDH